MVRHTHGCHMSIPEKSNITIPSEIKSYSRYSEEHILAARAADDDFLWISFHEVPPLCLGKGTLSRTFPKKDE